MVMVSEQSHVLDHVLVVDDDPILCAIAETHFQKRGSHNVTTAGDGVQALKALDEAQDEPSFLLCDLNMPNMDGIEFLRHLERRKFSGAIAILSGEHESVVALAESLAETHKLNVVGKLQKPFKADKLDELIATAQARCAAPALETNTVINADDLKKAISTGQIIAFHQPKIDTRTGHFIGTEALARWRHPEWGIVPPSRFITLAEQKGLIEQLTDVMLDAAISDVKHWKAHGLQASCSINLSAIVLTNINLPDEIAARVDAAGLERQQIILEITESSLLEKLAVPMEVLVRLRLKGFDLSVDDFGTGHSNIEMLRDFPFSELKIDQSFVSEMQEDEFAAESVRSSVELGRKLGLRLVAEGVETRAVSDLVKQSGIDQVQGYFFGKPMPCEKLPLWLKGYRIP
jgi:EAL domain-containing protein (putative c-di-GMP-specific phosphodiesterase class I)